MNVIVEMEGPIFEYIDADEICAGLDSAGDLYTWGGGKTLEKIDVSDVAVMDFIVEGKCIKYLDLEGKLWKYPLSEDNRITFQLFKDVPPFQLLYGSGKHGFALSNAGELWGWGQNNQKQLGIEFNPFVPVPRKIECEQLWKFICCKDDVSLLISQEGDVYQWGRCTRSGKGAMFKIENIKQAYVDKVYSKSARK
eukprot:CAMPEP_0206188706 /NCGR_PEP_ID=MMETSP0166-20121206/3732_1 /ASSEMBLY_ACC=CAM_ASM_000260 /TAXON_ID=95228 /ORGANISM="Vannella robusta, Strain DIVA3 518/3/11/1/6" /LENGTH=194 /DNA_ID=CAMNT_0053604481 /DNA_START=727 /DNA_END=1311 /DNA_ORIENTATION=-